MLILYACFTMMGRHEIERQVDKPPTKSKSQKPNSRESADVAARRAPKLQAVSSIGSFSRVYLAKTVQYSIFAKDINDPEHNKKKSRIGNGKMVSIFETKKKDTKGDADVTSMTIACFRKLKKSVRNEEQQRKSSRQQTQTQQQRANPT